MNNFLLKIFAYGLALAIPLVQLHAEETSAKGQVQWTINEMLKIVKAYPGETNNTLRRQKLRELISPYFDFDEMSKRSLGTNWNERSAEEQKEFVSLFSDLLAKTYLARIENIQDDTVTVDKEDLNFPKALVKTTIFYKGDKFPLDYRMYSQNGKWRIYDVIIENIGLVANYRNEFAAIIRKDDFSGLLAKLREKNTAKS